MLILTKCTVTAEEPDAAGLLGDIDARHQGDLRLVHTGNTVTISAKDQGRRRAVDQLTRASVSETRGGGYQVEGISHFLTNVINLHPDDARISLHVTGTDGCVACH